MSGLKRKIKELERENVKLRRKLKSDPSLNVSSKKKKNNKTRDEPNGPDVEDKGNKKGNDKKSKKDSMLSDFTVDIKEIDDEDEDRGSVLIHDDEEEDEKTKEEITALGAGGGGTTTTVGMTGTKRRGSLELTVNSLTSAEIVEIGDEDDEWGSDTAGDEMMDNLAVHLKAEDTSMSGDDEHLELQEYVHQLHEYRDKLDRETDENLELQFKIDAKNMELEMCGNKIAELMEELNHNDRDFHDHKSKIAHLQHVLAQYQTAYPSFKPDAPVPAVPTTAMSATTGGSSSISSVSYPSPLTIGTSKCSNRSNRSNRKSVTSHHSRSSSIGNGMFSPLGPLHGDYQGFDRTEGPSLPQTPQTPITPVTPSMLQHRLSLSQQSHRLSLSHLSAAGSRSQSVVIPSHLLENLLSLHQRMESKMKDTESALAEIKQNQRKRMSLMTTTKSNQSPIHYEDDEVTNDLESTLGDDGDGHQSDRGIEDDEVDDVKSVGGSSALTYESADEKLSEWDLDVSVMGSLSDTSKGSEGVLGTVTGHCEPSTIQKGASFQRVKCSNGTITKRSTGSETLGLDTSTRKELKEHLRSLSKNEKKLKRDLELKLKEEAVVSSGWCKCFWLGSTPKKEEGAVSGQLMEQYLRMQVRKELVKDRYQRKKEKNRAKILRKRMRERKKEKRKRREMSTNEL